MMIDNFLTGLTFGAGIVVGVFIGAVISGVLLWFANWLMDFSHD